MDSLCISFQFRFATWLTIFVFHTIFVISGKTYPILAIPLAIFCSHSRLLRLSHNSPRAIFDDSFHPAETLSVKLSHSSNYLSEVFRVILVSFSLLLLQAKDVMT